MAHRNRLGLLIMLVCLFVVSVRAQSSAIPPTIAPPITSPRLDCPYGIDQCEYTPDPSVAFDDYYQRVVAAVYQGISPIYPNYMRVLNRSIVFWDQDPTTLERIKRTLITLDHKQTYTPGPSIFVTVKVYTIDSEAYDSFASSLQFTLDPADPSKQTRASGTVDSSGSYNIAAILGNMNTSTVTARLQNLNRTHQSQMVQTYSAPTSPGDDIGISQSQLMYLPTSISTEKESAGLSVSGTVELDGTNPNLIHISNMAVQYSAPTQQSNSLVTAFSFRRNFLDLETDKSLVVTTNAVDLQATDKQHSFWFLGLGHGSQQKHARMIITLDAQIINPGDAPVAAKAAQPPARLSVTEAQTLAPGDREALRSVLASLRANVMAGADGDPAGNQVTLQLDPKTLTQNTYNRILRIDLKAGAVKQTLYPEIQSLALAPLKLDSSLLQSSCDVAAPDCLVNIDMHVSLDSKIGRNADYTGERDFNYRLQYLPHDQAADLSEKR